MKLQLPHITQTGHKAACGPACLLMLTSAETYEQAYEAMNLEPGKFAHIYHNLRAGLSHYGIKSSYARLRPVDIRAKINDGHPVVCLINYGRVPEGIKRARYDGAHYVVATGATDDAILIHDPLGNADNGAYISYPDGVLEMAMQAMPGVLGYSYQCLIVDMIWKMEGETAVSPALQLRVLFKRLGVSNLGDALVRIGELERGR